MLSFSVEVFTQGWQPNSAPLSTSPSTSRRTWPSRSFISPITETEPGASPSRRSMSSGVPKESRAEQICAEISRVWKGLSPCTSSK